MLDTDRTQIARGAAPPWSARRNQIIAMAAFSAPEGGQVDVSEIRWCVYCFDRRLIRHVENSLQEHTNGA